MEDLRVVIKLIKIKIKDKENYLNYSVKSRNYSALEGIVLLDTAIDILRNDFKLSENEIWELLKDYRANLKEKESD